jgi:hypothetical protein
MALGPHVKEWRELEAALEELVTRLGAANAAVADAWNDLWCRAHSEGGHEKTAAFELLDRALATLGRPLPRGGKLDLCESAASPWFIARSFAAVYVLLVWFDGPFQAEAAQTHIKRALPTIERLTTSLPPPNGHDDAANSGRLP